MYTFTRKSGCITVDCFWSGSMYTFTRKSGCIAVDCFLEWFYVYFHS